MTQTATGGTATDKAQEVGAQAKEKAQEAGAQARGRVRDEVDRRSTEAGQQASSTAQALRDASGKLREDGNEPVAKGLEQVADRVERAGGWLRDSDGEAILRDVEDFGRRNPLAVVAGGMAIGFAASRLLKASSRRRYETGTAPRPSYTPAPTGNGTATAPVPPAPATATTPVPPAPATAPAPPPAAATSSSGWQGRESEGFRGP